MDAAWTWGILAAIAFTVASAVFGVAPGIIDRTPKFGWWLLTLSPLPLVVWNILWFIMADPPDGTRRSITLAIGAIAGAVILLGVSELLHGQPSSKSDGPMSTKPTSPPSINAPNNSGIIAPNNSGTITQNQAPPPKLAARDCKRIQMPTGLIQWTCELMIEYAGIVPRLTVVPRGLDVVSVEMIPHSGSVAVTVGYEAGKLKDGRSYVSCQNASGLYQVTVVRRDDLQPIFDYSFK